LYGEGIYQKNHAEEDASVLSKGPLWTREKGTFKTGCRRRGQAGNNGTRRKFWLRSSLFQREKENNKRGKKAGIVPILRYNGNLTQRRRSPGKRRTRRRIDQGCMNFKTA